MNPDKILDERFFVNNTKEEIMHWCKELHYFHYMRARGGHNCEGDLDHDTESQMHCISRENYPELHL